MTFWKTISKAGMCEHLVPGIVQIFRTAGEVSGFMPTPEHVRRMAALMVASTAAGDDAVLQVQLGTALAILTHEMELVPRW